MPGIIQINDINEAQALIGNNDEHLKSIEEGFDAPIANVIIMAGCGRSERKAIQSTGRVLRPHDGKACGIIHDFRDGFHPMLQRQSQARARIYRQLNYY